jgi:hypothetical protein
VLSFAHPMRDTAWKMGDQWVLVTDRSPREMERKPMAIYYPRQGSNYFQYLMDRKPRHALLISG